MQAALFENISDIKVRGVDVYFDYLNPQYSFWLDLIIAQSSIVQYQD